jgi:hypothetical protein
MPNGLVSDVMVTGRGFTMYVDVMELLELPLWMQVLRQAGMNAAPVASPLAPMVWYSASASVAVGGAAVPIAIRAVGGFPAIYNCLASMSMGANAASNNWPSPKGVCAQAGYWAAWYLLP